MARSEDSIAGATTAATGSDDGREPPASLVLTVMCHPDVARIGEQCAVPWRAGGALTLTRQIPDFEPLDGGPAGPLADRGVSRKPLTIQVEARGVRLVADTAPAYLVGGRPLEQVTRIPVSALVEGQPLRCGRRVLLWLEARPPPAGPPVGGPGPLAGVSVAADRLRDRVALLAGAPFPVMVRGEPDTGRRAVARALHDDGPDAEGPFVAVAGADVQALEPLVEQATDGTLLIVGPEDLSDPMQEALLRWLAREPTPARLLTVTAVNLHGLASAGRFRAPLVYRLSTARVDVPPLRERRVDLPRLLVRALRARKAALGLPDRMVDPDQPWLRPALVEQLLLHRWPGNLRELDNLALEVALGSHIASEARLPEGWAPTVAVTRAPDPGEAPGDPADGIGDRPWSEPPDIDARAWAVPPDALRAALARHDFRVRPASDDLGISRNTVYAMMGRLGIRRPSDLSAGDIVAAIEAEGSRDVLRIARRLQVSTHGLRLRVSALGLALD